MGAAAEGQMSAGSAIDAESIGVIELPFIAVGGREHQQQCATGGNRLILETHIVRRDESRHMRARRLVECRLPALHNTWSHRNAELSTAVRNRRR